MKKEYTKKDMYNAWCNGRNSELYVQKSPLKYLKQQKEMFNNFIKFYMLLNR